MLGIIATIVAAVKRRYVFAAVIGGWTFIAFILAVNGLSAFALSPGFLFLIIAICMKKVPKDGETEKSVLNAEIVQSDDPEMKFVCMSCGTYRSDWYNSCPVCGSFDRIKRVEEAIVSDAPEQDEQRIIYFCRNCGYVGNDLSGKANSCPKCREALLETGLNRAQWLSFSEAEKDAAKENWHSGILSEVSEVSDSDAGEPPEKTEPACDAVAAAVPKFCRACGKSLSSANHFCPYCGTEILIPENLVSLSAEESTLPEAQLLSNDSVPVDDVAAPADALLCEEPLSHNEEPPKNSGGSIDSEDTGNDQPYSQEEFLGIEINNANISPLIRRAFLFIEDSEWERADNYLENALDQEPENAFAYIGKLLISLKLNEVSDLLKYRNSLETNNYYKRAMRFADPELKTELQKLTPSVEAEGKILV